MFLAPHWCAVSTVARNQGEMVAFQTCMNSIYMTMREGSLN
jgi:hypothetical protein